MLYEISFDAKELVYEVFFALEDLGVYLFNIILLIWSYRLLKKSPTKNRLTEQWVQKLWWFICIITVTWIILFIVDVFLIESYPVLDHYIIYDLYILAIQLSLLVYWIAYTGLYKLRIANERKEILDILHDEPQHEVIVPSANFLESNSYFVQLEQLLNEQHIYRDPNLSREVVAEKLGISAGYLSQIVNKITEKNFTAYINSFRVEETKRMILDEQFDKYSLLSIGLESGFKSKTTFYNSFKKETGFTPNEFKNNHK
jgi:AraC-like DNA-binding protein